MHGYPLYGKITADCDCCKIPHEFEFSSKSDHVICPGCKRHLGDSPNKWALRDKDHAALYRSELLICLEDRDSDRKAYEARILELKEQHDKTVRGRDVQLSDLRAAIRDGELNPGVQQWLADEQVGDALRKRDSAYRSRDFAFAALWRVARFHRPDECREGQCACGRKETTCRELQAIGSELSALGDWEATQIDRVRDDREHGLPREHPEVIRLGGTHLRRGRAG